jgi:predicted metal-binding membrane protein
MVMLLALGVMSVTWMSLVAVLAVAQKLLPPTAVIECRWRSRSSP